jgi:glycosyltransferase involved in cell wall biosynthesis
VRALKQEFSGIGLVILLPQIGDANYFQELQRRVHELDLHPNILFWTEPLDGPHHLWARADVFVRATNTDGDAISVRESLSLRVPVVASDASPRPPGVSLFAAGNLVSLLHATRGVLAHPKMLFDKFSDVDLNDHFTSLVDLYRNIWRQ